MIAAALSGCTSAIQDANTDSRFLTPDTSGYFSNVLNNETGGRDIALDGDGYAYRVGGKSSGGFVGHSGIIPGTAVAAMPTTGSASYTGTYEMATITGIYTTSTMIFGTTGTRSGVITLDADFADGTLTGSTSGLVIDATIDDGDVGGSVRYLGTDGSIDGMIGSDRVVGVFQGDDEDIIFAGGFMADAD